MNNETEHKPVDLTRRRLAKGGLAASVVLATLASRNVLAAVPYQCTISGMISGNTSPNGPASEAPCALGSSGSEWSAALTNEQNSPGARTLADLSLTSAYDTKPGNGNPPTIVRASPNGDRATLYEILNYEAGSPAPENLDYAKKALVLYLNAESLNGAAGMGHDFYPLNTMEAREIFNAIVAGAGYAGTTSLGAFSWTNFELKAYVDLLYH